MGSLRRSLDTYRWDRTHRARQRASDLPLSRAQINGYVETLNREELLALVGDVLPESRASESVGVPQVVAAVPGAGA